MRRFYVAAIDLFLNAMTLFLIAVILMLPLLNPPTEEHEAEPPGNLIVTIVWPTGPTDVDLWLDGPGEARPVGYSNKGGKLWNLLRDDLGSSLDVTGMNFENGYSRGVVAGEYTINLHCYSCPSVPLVVSVEVAINKGDNTSLMVLATTKTTLVHAGQEKTAIRFYLTTEGRIRDGSMSAVYRPLRSAKK